jgi:hypothetical protein
MFYRVFATKDDCFLALMMAANQGLLHHIVTAVDPDAPWQAQARQAAVAYLDKVATQPGVFLMRATSSAALAWSRCPGSWH